MLFQAYNRSPSLRKAISEKQWLFVFLAALAHDLNHPGTCNSLEVKMKSHLAAEAQNVSVLEKMHLSVFWNILKKNSQVNFLQGFPSYEAYQIKKLITRLILATSFYRHNSGI